MRKFNYTYKKPSTHRIRAEEKKLNKRIIKFIAFFVLSVVFFVYVGLPVFVKIIATFSSPGKQEETQEDLNSPIFPPVLDDMLEATNSATITISGYSDKETTVKILVNGEEQTKVLTDEDGKFTVDNIHLEVGLNTIKAMAMKKSKESKASNTIEISYIEEPPSLEIISPEENKQFSDDERQIEIIGQTDSNVEVTINGRMAIVDQNGKFSYAVRLDDGENKYEIKAIDAAGNETTLEWKVEYKP